MTTALTVRRSQDDIVARIRVIRRGFSDIFGAEQSDLTGALDYDHAKEFLEEDVTAERWAEVTRKAPYDQAVDYVAFAVDKINGHRGLSAGRSVSHFRAWAWLLLDDVAFEQFEDAGYENYGAPQVRKFCELIGRPDLWPNDDPGLRRMADGYPCRDGCEEGCGAS